MKVGSSAEHVRDKLRESIAVKEAMLLDEALLDSIEKVAHLCVHSLSAGGKLIFFGNGGSAADSQHLAAELVGRYLRDRKALAAIALTTDTSCLTAIANDQSFDDVFSRQIEAIGTKGDVAIGISTSGNSRNVVCAVGAARTKGLSTVGMTGTDGGRLASEAEHCLRVPSSHVPRIQECHIFVGHILCELIEAAV